MKKKQIDKQIDEISNEIKPEREVLREPGQISFKDAMKKVVGLKPKNKYK